MTTVVLTHRGANKETAAVKALLEYYGCTVEERVLSLTDLVRITAGRARVHFEFRGKVYYTVDTFISDLSTRGLIYC
jgi:hypothetical protein